VSIPRSALGVSVVVHDAQSRPDGYTFGSAAPPAVLVAPLPWACPASLGGLRTPGGHPDACTGTVEIIPPVPSGRLRTLASASVDRWSGLPDAPTLRELGHDTVARQLADPAAQARLEGASIASRPIGRAGHTGALRAAGGGRRA
jgi:hypothetical protein